jgi:hypothetical protein
MMSMPAGNARSRAVFSFSTAPLAQWRASIQRHTALTTPQTPKTSHGTEWEFRTTAMANRMIAIATPPHAMPA